MGFIAGRPAETELVEVAADLLLIAIPAEGAIHLSGKQWIPAYAGMTILSNL